MSNPNCVPGTYTRLTWGFDTFILPHMGPLDCVKSPSSKLKELGEGWVGGGGSEAIHC